MATYRTQTWAVGRTVRPEPSILTDGCTTSRGMNDLHLSVLMSSD